MTNEQLLKKYEQNLAKVKAAYSGDFRKENYIKYAEEQLEAVKKGGYDGLMKFYEERRIDE